MVTNPGHILKNEGEGAMIQKKGNNMDQKGKGKIGQKCSKTIKSYDYF